jgi:hypothetical protein
MLAMPPLNQIEITLRGGRHGSELRAGNFSFDSDFNKSISSEISLEDLQKLRTEESSDGSSSFSRWDPESSLDYSLSVLLPIRGPDDGDDSCTDALLNSEYSLSVNLGKSKPTLDDDVPSRTLPTASNSSRSTQTEESNVSRRKVSFYARVRIKRVPNRKDLGKDLIEDVWYSRSEFKDIRKECFSTIKLMKSLSLKEEYLEEDDDYCTRGLEYKTDQAYRERQKNKMDIRTLVIEEQEYQFLSEMNDPQWIAKLAQEQSRECIKIAIAAAEKDERAAKEYHLSS